MKSFSISTTLSKWIMMITICFTALLSTNAFGAGLLKPTDGSDADVHTKSHIVNVTINNGFAQTEVDQVFMNTGDKNLEAIYSFPVPKDASLSEVSMWIDGKEVIGEVLEKEKARQIHTDQKAKGNDTALAEKNDYKTFRVKVYPVRAQDETRIRIIYYQPLEIDLNVGRYVYQIQEGNTDEEQIAFWTVDDTVNELFQFNLTLKSSFPVKDIRLPNFQKDAVITQVQGNETASTGETYTVQLSYPEGGSLSNDIVMYYRLDDTTPAQVELVPYRDGDTGTFMVTVTPGASLKKIDYGTDWVFVLDTSGSMAGAKIDTVKNGMKKLLRQMNANDRIRIVTFDDSASTLTRGYVSTTSEKIDQITDKIDLITAGGGTNLYAGLKEGYMKLDEDRITGVILVTDAVANIDKTLHSDFMKLVKSYDIRLFPFIVGNGANQPLMERFAQATGGFPMNISTNDDIIGRIIQAKAKVSHEAFYNASLKIKGEKVMNLTPAHMRNLYNGEQMTVFGQYKGDGDVTVEFSANVAGERKTWKTRAHLPETDTDNPEIERLWALSSIKQIMQDIRLTGKTDAKRQAVVDLGTEYSLVTDYTSMLVLSETEMENLGIQRNNAARVHKERQAQKIRAKQPVKSYRVDNKPSAQPAQRGTDTQTAQQSPSNNGMFGGSRSSGIGGGPVGPLFAGAALWLLRRKKNNTK